MPLLFVLALLVSAPALAGPHHHDHPPEQEPPLGPFFDSDFTYCDAEYLSKAWGGSLLDAKLRLSEGIAAGASSALRAEAASARARAVAQDDARCEYHVSRYTYEDAEVLGAAWNISPWEAKQRISGKIAAGNEAALVQLLGSQQRPQQAADPESRSFEIWGQSGYNYCDAKLVARAWSQPDPYQGKLRIGEKIALGARAEVDTALNVQRSVALATRDLCEYTDGYYGPQQVQALASLWSVNVKAAQKRMGEMLTRGEDSVIKADLASVGL